MIFLEQFTFIGSVKDNQPYAKQKVRLDKRRIREARENFTLEAGSEFELLNEGERGDLYEIRIVADNPYLQVLISIDNWLVESFTIAELLLQPGTGRLLSNFQAIAGDTPSQGYTLIYNPDIPESYYERIRIVLKFPMDKKNDHRTNPAKELFGRFEYGNLRIAGVAPGSGGGQGGFVLEIPSFGNLPNHELSVDDTGPGMEGYTGLGRFGERVSRHMMMTDASEIPEYSGREKVAFDQTDRPSRRGAGHPFIGLAGLFSLGRNDYPFNPSQDAYGGSYTSTRANIFFDNSQSAEAPGSGFIPNKITNENHTDIYICDPTTNTEFQFFPSGKATPVEDDIMCIRDGDRFYFPGVVTLGPIATTLPTKFAKNGSSQYTNAIRYRVSPGFRYGMVPPTIRLNTEDVESYASSTTGIFTVRPATSTFNPGDGSIVFDKLPKLKIFKAEVKRRKFVSYDG